MKNYYEILEVNEHASQEIIQKVYKILAKKYHPDTQNTDKKISAEKFKELAEAYEVLSNEESRMKYDEQLQSFKDLQESATIQELQNYCIRLENELSAFKTNVSRFEQIRNKAYNDAYINTLRKSGFKVKQKLTFKQFMKNIMVWSLTAVIVSIIAVIVWNIPSLKEWFLSSFSIFENIINPI